MFQSLILAILGLSLAPSHRAETISFECKAESVTRALKDLSGATGLHLAADPDTGREIVIISVTNAPIQDLLAAIAKVTAGTWNGDRLQALNSLWQKQTEDLGEARVKYIKDQLADYIAQNYGLAAKFEAKLISSLDISEIANLNDSQKIVYSTVPNELEHLLPVSPDEVKAFVKEYNKSSEGAGPNRISSPPTKIMLTVERSPLKIIETRMVFLDKRGKKTVELSYVGFDTVETDVAGPSDINLASMKGGNPLTLSPAASLLRSSRGSNLPPDLESKLVNPDKYDPASFVVSEAFIQWARARKTQLVADVPDGLDLFDQDTRAQTDESFMSAVTHYKCGVSAEDANGWTYITPKQPTLARSQRFDRKVWSTFLKKAHKDPVLGLDAFCNLAMHCKAPGLGTSVPFDHFLMPPMSFSKLVSGGERHFNELRFFGLLTPAQRQYLFQGRSILVSSLSRQQKRAVRILLQGGGCVLGDDKNPPAAILDMTGTTQPPFLEPAEFLSGGRFGTVVISAKVETKPVAITQSGSWRYTTLDATWLARFELKRDPDILQHLTAGQQSNIEIYFHVTPTLYSKVTYEDNNFQPDAPVVPFNRLPKPFMMRLRRSWR
jgi:hypothetical protein